MPRTLPSLGILASLAVGALAGGLWERNSRTINAQAPALAPPLQAEVAPVAARAASETDLYDQLDRQYAQFEQVNRTFELVAKAVSPSVVHIVAHKVGKREGERREHEFEETGSGVIVRGDGRSGLFVLTNNHVVSGARANEVQVFLHDGRAIQPERIWTDSRADVAVLALSQSDLPAARLGNSDRVTVGTWVLAIGSPFGLTHSVSQGIISGRGRHEADLELAGVENQDFLQTDAAINPGNSGGPLVNLKGEVVGLNIAILSNGGGSEGVGFTIPINLARWIMNQLITRGRVARGALGVKLRPNFVAENARELGLDRPRGAWIDAVDRSSPAAKAGLKVGDVVLRFNQVDVVDLNHLINLVSMTPIGQPAEVVIWRERREIPIRVVVGDKDAGQAINAAVATRAAQPDGFARRPKAVEEAGATSRSTANVLGLELATLNAELASRLGLPESLSGAVIMKVEPASPVGSYFKPLDVVHSIGEVKIRTADDAATALGARAETDHLELGLHRVSEGMLHSLKVRLP